MGGVGSAVEIWVLKRVDKRIQLLIRGWARDAGDQPWPGGGPVWGGTMTRQRIIYILMTTVTPVLLSSSSSEPTVTALHLKSFSGVW